MSGMGEVRLYALGIEELRGIFGASADQAAHLRGVAGQALAPAPTVARTGLIGKLGPIFRRPPATAVISPTQPEPADVEMLLTGAYVPPERTGAAWRLLEIFVAGMAWGSTRMSLTAQALDDLDFALARGGVSSSVGLRHLLDSSASLPLVPVPGLTVGWHRHETALAMAGVYRSAVPQLPTPEQQELTAALAVWLDSFVPWAHASTSRGRPVPDLVAFWAR